MGKWVWILLLFLQEAHWVQPYSSMVGRRGDELRIDLSIMIEEGYHIQDVNPDDPNLIPTNLALDLPHGWELVSVNFPATEGFTLHGENKAMQVFSGEVLIEVRVDTNGQDLDVFEIKAILQYQACDDKKCYYPRTLEFYIDVF